METKTISIADLEAIDEAAREFAAEMGDYTVFAFYGEMGAGKTTFISALCRVLGVEEDVTNSPSGEAVRGSCPGRFSSCLAMDKACIRASSKALSTQLERSQQAAIRSIAEANAACFKSVMCIECCNL